MGESGSLAKRLAELPKTEGLKRVGVRWKGQLKVRPER